MIAIALAVMTSSHTPSVHQSMSSFENLLDWYEVNNDGEIIDLGTPVRENLTRSEYLDDDPIGCSGSATDLCKRIYPQHNSVFCV